MEGKSPSVGIDVSKATLDLRLYPSGKSWQAEHSPAGMSALAEELVAPEPAVVVVEATGGLEVSLAVALGSARLPVTVVNPRHVRDFARATGRLSKTDKLDAQSAGPVWRDGATFGSSLARGSAPGAAGPGSQAAAIVGDDHG